MLLNISYYRNNEKTGRHQGIFVLKLSLIAFHLKINQKTCEQGFIKPMQLRAVCGFENSYTFIQGV